MHDNVIDQIEYESLCNFFHIYINEKANSASENVL